MPKVWLAIPVSTQGSSLLRELRRTCGLAWSECGNHPLPPDITELDRLSEQTSDSRHRPPFISETIHSRFENKQTHIHAVSQFPILLSAAIPF